MTVGFRVKDKNGNIVLDLNDRITRVVGSFDTGTSNGSITDGNLSGGSVWYYANLIARGQTSANLPVFTVSGTTISWVFPASTTGQFNVSIHVVYGLY